MQFKFGNIWLNGLTFKEAVDKILFFSSSNKPCIISLLNLRTIGISMINKDYAKLINDTSLRITDGMPLIWAGKILRLKNIERITGPDLFNELLNPKYGLNHFFLGDTIPTLENLKNKIQSVSPDTKNCGYYSPPFRVLSEEDILQISREINQSGPDIIWIALGSPKQDYFSHLLIKYLAKGILINVGAAFRFYIGEYKHPHPFFQRIGLEGIFWRFKKNPMKESIWYIKHISLFIYLIIILLLSRNVYVKK